MKIATQTKEEIQVEMFGETVGSLRLRKPEGISGSAYAMAILSDVQELTARLGSKSPYTSDDADKETIRQWINIAKFWIMETKIA